MTRFLLALFLIFVSAPAIAQETPDEERSFFVRYVEEQLSAPNRQIRLNNIQGVLSSNASIGEITIADREGIWLRITNARIVWTRTALLRGNLNIDTLSADRIDVVRKPVPAEGLPPPEAGSGFAIPELPVSVQLGQLQVPLVVFGEELFGLAAQISVGGRMSLSGGALDTALQIQRLDGPGGQFDFTASYANQTQVLGLDLSLNEPENGLVANLLGIEGRPPIAMTLKGSGPIATLDLALTMDAASQRVLEGTTSLRQAQDGIRFTADVGGPIANIIPARFRSFFGADTRLQTAGTARTGGGLTLDSLTLNSAALSVQASAETAADGFPRRLNLNAVIDHPQQDKTLLPIAGGQTTVTKATVDLSFGEGTSEAWDGRIRIDDLSTESFATKLLDVTLGGEALNLNDPANRAVTFSAKGGATGIVATDAAMAEALGEKVDLDVEGSWRAGQPIDLPRASITANGLSLNLAGAIAEMVFNGTIGIDAASITPFSALAGRNLAGRLNLQAKGTLSPLKGGFDLTLDGTGSGLEVGIPAADNLLQGETRLSGGVARGDQGLVARQFRIANDQVALTADGTFATGAANFGFDLALEDLSQLSDRVTGRLTASGRASGSGGLIGLTFGADVANGSVVGKNLTDTKLAFEGTLQDGDLNAQITGNAFLDGVRAQLSSGLAVANGERRLTDLNFTAGGAAIKGNLTQAANGLLNGTLTVDAADISTLAALAVMEAQGAIDAQVALVPAEGKQSADIKANIQKFRLETVEIGNADIAAAIGDLFGVPIVDGTASASNVKAGGIDISRFDGKATRQDTTTDFSATASLANGADATVAGALTPVDAGFRLALSTLQLTQGNLSARLAQPASLLIQGQNVRIDDLALDVGGGRIEARGDVAEALNLEVDIRALPLAIANAIRPDLQLGGTVEGRVTVRGTRVQPDINFTLRANAVAAAALRQAGLSSVSLDASGQSSTTRLAVRANMTSPEGLRASVDGGIPLDNANLDLNIDVASFPLATLNAVAPGQGLGGALSGTARVTGRLADPAATFDIRGAAVRATALDDAGLSPLEVAARGSYARRAVTLDRATVSGPQGLSVSGNGRIPLAGSGLDVSVSGEAPLALANRFLAERGTQVSGTLSLSASVSGSIQGPAVRGMFSTVGARVVDPEANVQLNDIAVMGAIEGDRIDIRNASAALSTGGRLSASGTISTNAAAGFPADIRIVLDNARYADGEMVVATLSGNLALTGPLTRDPLLAGNIDIARAEITVPESLAAGAAQIDVKHKNASAAVRETLRRARANDGTPVPRGRPSVVRLDVKVNAPNQVFIRGRGLDTEIGGSVRLTGPVTDIQPVGAFELIRGRLSILGQRITFDEGEVTLVGDLDPFVNFVARSGSDDITVFITVRGRVSDLDISFSSQPTLPEDEVLARLIFKRSLGELSPLQIAQLAAAAAELAGGSNTSLLGSLREATGLDDLDVVTDSEGNAAVRAGRYVRDNVYLGVEAGAEGTTRGTINLDITDNLRARGAVASDGDSSVGLFYEKDY
ncbi:translocation/assembly module TamB domain-containing protein [Arvimicrobium flavum]|uniref:translocation/assembly module TamB domain-containing protein n=1 Tax=Arvimicrobium flavum TaxID=3393320 RepID=UPI00237B76B1|nr:translocation/assembly module TamB domain-containing protein [Mesorhizobium shangrilense]